MKNVECRIKVTHPISRVKYILHSSFKHSNHSSFFIHNVACKISEFPCSTETECNVLLEKTSEKVFLFWKKFVRLLCTFFHSRRILFSQQLSCQDAVAVVECLEVGRCRQLLMHDAQDIELSLIAGREVATRDAVGVYIDEVERMIHIPTHSWAME